MLWVVHTGLAQIGYQRLTSFGDPTQAGTLPHAALLFGADGALYGTTLLGGTNNQGTVFKMNPDGTGYRELHGFVAGGDGKDRLGRCCKGRMAGSTGRPCWGAPTVMARCSP